MEWISVKDRLPPVGTGALLYFYDSSDENLRWFIMDGLREEKSNNPNKDFGFEVIGCLCEFRNGEQISHWMSLPSCPEKE